LSRRDFMEKLALGTAALALAGDLATSADGKEKGCLAPPKPLGGRAYPMTLPRVYRGKNLEAVGMPIGGIGAGSIWLDGQGQLGVWQIFNNLSEPRIPGSFFGVRVRQGTGEAVTRVLQTKAEGSLPPVESLSYEGGYPIARLAFHDADLPIQVTLEAMNPLIPLDAANSSIPCAIFRLTAKNPGTTAAEATLFATLQNAVGSGGAADIQGVRLAGYGGNRNRLVRNPAWTGVAMDKAVDPVASGPVKVRTASGQESPGPELFWLAGLSGLTNEPAELLARTAAEGGVVLADGARPDFFRTVAVLSAKIRDFSSVATVFEDFESKTYEGWTITGTAFGKGPSHGAEPGQQAVGGFAGHGLVNTFLGGDSPQGTATSKPFAIERRYIGFLIGGGSHAGKTCVNLRVDGKVVRTATGKDREELGPATWDVADLKGRQAVIEIVDQSTDGWGHINVDQIIFSDVPPEPLLQQGTLAHTAAKALALRFAAADEATLPGGSSPVLTEHAPAAIRAVAGQWKVSRYTRLRGFRSDPKGYRALATTPDGDPLVIEGPLGKGRIILALAPGLPWAWGREMLTAARRPALKRGERLLPGNPAWGTMALAAFDANAVALPAWTNTEELARFLANPTIAKPAAGEAGSQPGETINGALGVPLTLQAGESRTVTFAITWHFPNVQRFQHSGNLYSRRWLDATAVADFLATNLEALCGRTQLYHQTLYQSNLPEEFLDAMTSQSVILRGPTCFWSEDGYFGGFEGSYGCCPLNCTHVWNYAQSHARLFPTVGQNMRVSNFVTFLHANGETSHREHAVHEGFIDGHCACIEAAYREYQLSPDRRLLTQIWPGVKKAVDWLIQKIDPKREGVPHGQQFNTYDTACSGANTFIGSQYLAALAAGERMAEVMDDAESAERWRTVRLAGMKNQDEKLWNGEYYIQIPELQGASDYNTGCHSDQLLGQWWAHMLNLGYLYPAPRVKSALAAVMKHNFREKFAGFKQAPRRYIGDDEGGLIICTWPRGGRPKPFILYADEVWTGIEYAAAGAMLYEGLIDQARQVVRTARSRYDGRRRDGVDSGPGGNPFNELECGKFYARAMSSWSLLIASQGLVLEGPKGILGFKPHWQPEDHRSFYTAPEGWGLFVQQRKPGEQTERIEVRHGRLRLAELVFELPKDMEANATVTVAGQPVAATLRRDGAEVRLVLEKEAVVPEGTSVEVRLQWTS
jgi:uncharacterized protein (DUF608 family)